MNIWGAREELQWKFTEKTDYISTLFRKHARVVAFDLQDGVFQEVFFK